MFNDFQLTTMAAAVGTGMLMASGLAWTLTRSPPPTTMKDTNYDCHSILIDKENYTRKSQFEPLSEIRRGEFGNIRTLYDIFQCGLVHGRDEPCLGYKPQGSGEYKWITYAQVDKNATSTGAGIIHRLNLSPEQNTRIGIFMKNCVEWVYIEQSCTRYSMVPVPLYDTLGEESCIFILNHVKCEAVFVDTQKKLDFLSQNKPKLQYLKFIIYTFDSKKETEKNERGNGLDILHFSEILKSGEENPQPLVLCKPDDISTIFFTSGTTGTPKGCVITHAALLSTIACAIMNIREATFGKKKEVHLSFLPLTHVYERLVHILLFMYTGKIAFFSGDIRFLIDEMKIIQPTIIFAVPRLMNRIYDRVLAKVSQSKIAKLLYDKGLSAKMTEVQRGIIRNNSVWDYLLFRKIQALLGGKAEIMLVGSAPISGSVLNFFRAVMGCIVLEGYGQTETSGTLTMTLPGDYTPGQVGPPVAGVQIKLCNVPELDIIVSRDGRGEICVKGPCCIKEYYDNAEMTAKLIDVDGWLHTGDVGLWTEKGQLKIVDRCKHIFKLSQGEYLAPEKLENVYGLSLLVSQIFVTGNSLKDYCVAVVIPELDGWRSLGKKYESVKEICDDHDSMDVILRNLEAVGREHKLMGFEIVKRVFLWPEQMSIENGLLTPTLKLKRIDVTKFFEEQLKIMYT